MTTQQSLAPQLRDEFRRMLIASGVDVIEN
jgi:hypothetical protein